MPLVRFPMNYKHIIWDWNGTLLDDLWLTSELCNVELRKRGLPTVDREEYIKKFRHPVIKFYERIGLDLSVHSYQELTDSFHADYSVRCSECELFEDIPGVLAALAEKGITHSILSALPQGILEQSVSQKGIAGYFVNVRGLDTNHADSKVQNGRDWLTSLDFSPEEVLLIGDTDHDVEVAGELGADCVLIARGHQHQDVLQSCGVPVLESASELLKYLSEGD